MNTLHDAVLAALDLEQQQLLQGRAQCMVFCRCGWSVCTDITARAQKLIDLRREIAERHATITAFVCDFCSDDIGRIADWPCPDYLAVARATLPADHPALTA